MESPILKLKGQHKPSNQDTLGPDNEVNGTMCGQVLDSLNSGVI